MLISEGLLSGAPEQLFCAFTTARRIKEHQLLHLLEEQKCFRTYSFFLLLFHLCSINIIQCFLQDIPTVFCNEDIK